MYLLEHVILICANITLLKSTKFESDKNTAPIAAQDRRKHIFLQADVQFPLFTPPIDESTRMNKPKINFTTHVERQTRATYFARLAFWCGLLNTGWCSPFIRVS